MFGPGMHRGFGGPRRGGMFAPPPPPPPPPQRGCCGCCLPFFTMIMSMPVVIALIIHALI